MPSDEEKDSKGIYDEEEVDDEFEEDESDEEDESEEDTEDESEEEDDDTGDESEEEEEDESDEDAGEESEEEESEGEGEDEDTGDESEEEEEDESEEDAGDESDEEGEDEDTGDESGEEEEDDSEEDVGDESDEEGEDEDAGDESEEKDEDDSEDDAGDESDEDTGGDYDVDTGGDSDDDSGGDSDTPDGNDETGVDDTTVPCPKEPTYTVKIKAADGVSDPCTIIPANGRLKLLAVPEPPCWATFAWSTDSPRIRIVSATANPVELVAGPVASPSRDAETVTLKLTPDGHSTLAPVSITVTVAVVRFSESNFESYGWDDLDNPSGALPHLSVKMNGNTRVRVAIEGGITTNELKYICDNPAVALCGEGLGDSVAHVSVTAGGWTKSETILRAKCRCKEAPDFTGIYINVYKEKPAVATVAKIWDSTSPGTRLQYPELDISGKAPLINAKYKAAVVNLQLMDFSPEGKAVDIQYDLDRNGKLTYEIGGRGPEYEKIKREFDAHGQRIVIVRDMISVYYLDQAASRGDTTLKFKSYYFPKGFFFNGGETPWIRGSHDEQIKIQSVDTSSGVVNLAPLPGAAAGSMAAQGKLEFDHPATDSLEFGAAGWGGDPILIAENTSTAANIHWIFAHELGHSILTLKDLDALTDVMHFQVGNPDHRLRYLTLPNHYSNNPGAENQWQKIPR